MYIACVPTFNFVYYTCMYVFAVEGVSPVATMPTPMPPEITGMYVFERAVLLHCVEFNLHR